MRYGVDDLSQTTTLQAREFAQEVESTFDAVTAVAQKVCWARFVTGGHGSSDCRSQRSKAEVPAPWGNRKERKAPKDGKDKTGPWNQKWDKDHKGGGKGRRY